MAGTDDAAAVEYRKLATDPALVSVLLISGIPLLGTTAVPVALPAMADAFQLTEVEIGLIMSVFQLGVLAMLPTVSVLSDIYGRRPVVIPSLLLVGLFGVLTLWVESYALLLALRVAQGLAFAGTLPLAATLIGDLYTGAEGSSAQGIRIGTNGLAAAVAPVVAGGLVVVAWQYPFALFAFSLPVAGLVYRYYPETVTSRRSSGDGETLREELRTYARTIAAVVDLRIGLLIAGGFITFFLKAGFRTFVPVLAASELGSTAGAVGLLLALYGGGRGVIAPFTGSMVARLGRKVTLLLGLGTAVVAIGSIPHLPTVGTLAVVVVGYAFGEAVATPVLNDAVAASVDDDQRGGVVGGLVVARQLSLLLAPVTLGALIGASGFEVAFLAAALLGAAYLLLLVWRYEPVSTVAEA